MGIDPVTERARRLRQATTPDACFNHFCKDRKHLSPKTLHDCDRVLRVALDDRRRQPISRIPPVSRP